MTSTLSGTLLRRDDGWYWRDGVREPRVHDMPVAAAHNYRCRTHGSGTTYVEVPIGRARVEQELAWVLAGHRDGRYQTSKDGDRTGPLDIGTGKRLHVRPGDDPLVGHAADADPLAHPIPLVILVPIDEWDGWARGTCLGAEWDRADEPAILERALSLGWSA